MQFLQSLAYCKPQIRRDHDYKLVVFLSYTHRLRNSFILVGWQLKNRCRILYFDKANFRLNFQFFKSKLRLTFAVIEKFVRTIAKLLFKTGTIHFCPKDWSMAISKSGVFESIFCWPKSKLLLGIYYINHVIDHVTWFLKFLDSKPSFYIFVVFLNPLSWRQTTFALSTDQFSWQMVPHILFTWTSTRPDPIFPPAFRRIWRFGGWRLRENRIASSRAVPFLGTFFRVHQLTLFSTDWFNRRVLHVGTILTDSPVLCYVVRD